MVQFFDEYKNHDTRNAKHQLKQRNLTAVDWISTSKCGLYHLGRNAKCYGKHHDTFDEEKNRFDLIKAVRIFFRNGLVEQRNEK